MLLKGYIPLILPPYGGLSDSVTEVLPNSTILIKPNCTILCGVSKMSGENKKDENNWEERRRGKVFSIQLSDELYNRVEEISKKYGIPKAQLIRDALIEKLNRLEKS